MAVEGKSLAKSSFLAPKLRLDARLLLKQVTSCLAVLAAVWLAVGCIERRDMQSRVLTELR
jgi:hypothetical protein